MKKIVVKVNLFAKAFQAWEVCGNELVSLPNIESISSIIPYCKEQNISEVYLDGPLNYVDGLVMKKNQEQQAYSDDKVTFYNLSRRHWDE